MRKHFDNYLYLNKNERNGLITLLILSFSFLSSPHLYDFFRIKESTNFSPFLNQIELQEKNNPKDNTSSQTLPSLVLKTIDSNAKLFYFDPNTASKEELLKLGLDKKTAKTILKYRQAGGYFYQPSDMKKIYNFSDEAYERIKDHIRIKGNKKQQNKKWTPILAKQKTQNAPQNIPINYSEFDPNYASEKILLENGIPQKQTKMIIKYRNKGGKFYKKEDLKKIYGMPESIYQNLESYIKIESVFPKKKSIAKASVPNEQNTQKSFKTIQIDINKAPAEEWQKLRGIGPAFSKRITKFRDALGGFYAINQVGETYGLPDSTFQSIKPKLIQSPIIKKININKATEDDLKKHPYISWKQAKLIISYRTVTLNL